MNHANQSEKGKDIKLTQRLLGARSADPDAMQEDGADGAPLTKTTTNDRSVTKQKADRVARRPRSKDARQLPNPQTPCASARRRRPERAANRFSCSKERRLEPTGHPTRNRASSIGRKSRYFAPPLRGLNSRVTGRNAFPAYIKGVTKHATGHSLELE
ncbi:hypothetical protein E2P81_ATG10583 [Venturia nashicola]|nr:hypothetical protein E2P81_ATG10583 [Venturia nashicola]